MSKNTKKTEKDNKKKTFIPITSRQYLCKDVDTRNFISIPIAKRNVPSSNLDTAYISHPATTRKKIMPIIDCRKESSEQKMEHSIYHPSKIFNPGQGAPFSGYASYVDHESTLFNRFAPLQKGGQHSYIPNSKSELYKEHIYSNNQLVQFKQLNKKELFNPFNPNKCNLANNMFQNHTRQQTKDL
tara:strand:+ start:4044 stop:4598 length:555 start_codon:yes stop_codon:yes gene_type:complete